MQSPRAVIVRHPQNLEDRGPVIQVVTEAEDGKYLRTGKEADWIDRGMATHAAQHDDIGLAAVTPAERGSDRFEALRRRLVVADIVAGVAAGAAAASLAVGASPAADPLGWVALVVGITIAWTGSAFVCGLQSVADLTAWVSGVRAAPKLGFAALACSWIGYFIAEAVGAADPALAAVATTVVCGTAASATRALARTSVHRAAALRQRTLLIGSGVVATHLVYRLRRHPELGLVPVGFIDDDVHGELDQGVPQLGVLNDLPRLLRSGDIDRVMIAFTRAGHDELLHAIRLCREHGVPVDIVPRLFEFLDGARTLEQIGGMPLLSITVPTFSATSRAAKRALDLVGATVSLLVLAPLLLVIMIAIKLESAGPVLFRQQRVGRHGRTFDVLKFRSMYVDADTHKAALTTDNDLRDGVMFKMFSDPRVTRVGRMLRRLSLDEIPQLLNVLRGEMSLVGPRPLVLPEAAALKGWQGRRVDLRPGLTGPWQIAGRSNVPFDEMVRFDYHYVTGWSLARDIEILLATLPAVLSGRGAY
jgi:exopolysaccharide biosynthesis polyprenyl glycosylphosphotransferase